jgi:hypothetical protein
MQGSGKKTYSYVQVDSREIFDTLMSRMNAVKPGVEIIDAELLNEHLQPDSTKHSEQTARVESCGLFEGTTATSRHDNNCDQRLECNVLNVARYIWQLSSA